MHECKKCGAKFEDEPDQFTMILPGPSGKMAVCEDCMVDSIVNRSPEWDKAIPPPKGPWSPAPEDLEASRRRLDKALRKRGLK